MDDNKKEFEEWKSKKTPTANVDIDVINGYLAYEYEYLTSLLADDLGVMLWNLRKYALILKQEENTYRARAKWLSVAINKALKPLASNYQSYDKDERFYSAMNEHEKYKEMNNNQMMAESKAIYLYDQIKQIDYLITMIQKLWEYKLYLTKTKKELAKDDTTRAN